MTDSWVLPLTGKWAGTLIIWMILLFIFVQYQLISMQIYYWKHSSTNSLHRPPECDISKRKMCFKETGGNKHFHHNCPAVKIPFFLLPVIFSPDNQAAVPSRSVSQLSYSSGGSGGAWGPRYGGYLPGPDDSEGDDDHSRPSLLYQSHLGLLSHTSEDSLGSSSAPPQVCLIVHFHIFQPWAGELIQQTLNLVLRIEHGRFRIMNPPNAELCS